RGLPGRGRAAAVASARTDAPRPSPGAGRGRQRDRRTTRPAYRRRETSTVTIGEPVAIIGMACRFPGAENLDEYWNLIRAGRVATGPVSPQRWRHAWLYAADDPRAADFAYTDIVAHLPDVAPGTADGRRRVRHTTRCRRGPSHCGRDRTPAQLHDARHPAQHGGRRRQF